MKKINLFQKKTLVTTLIFIVFQTSSFAHADLQGLRRGATADLSAQAYRLIEMMDEGGQGRRINMDRLRVMHNGGSKILDIVHQKLAFTDALMSRMIVQLSQPDVPSNQRQFLETMLRQSAGNFLELHGVARDLEGRLSFSYRDLTGKELSGKFIHKGKKVARSGIRLDTALSLESAVQGKGRLNYPLTAKALANPPKPPNYLMTSQIGQLVYTQYYANRQGWISDVTKHEIVQKRLKKESPRRAVIANIESLQEDSVGGIAK